MKKLITLLAAVALLGNVAGQTVLTLQPDSTDGQDAFIHDINVVWSGSGQHLVASAWTWQGNPGIQHTLLGFDLSTIPIASTVSSAYLSLWGKVNPPDQHSSLSGSNVAWLQRITSVWDENTVSWSTQPTVTTLNEVTLPQSITPDEDYLDIDVTALVQDMVDDPANSHGFMIKLQTEVEYRMMTFCASEHTNFSKHPKLVITYIPGVGVNETKDQKDIPVYPNPTTGQFTVSSGQLAQKIEVYDLFGRVVHTTTLPQVDMGGYAKGVYFIRVEETVQKLILN